MKILTVLSSLGVGGAERAASQLSLSLAAAHDVTVVTFHDRLTYEYGGRHLSLGLLFDAAPRPLEKVKRLIVKYTYLRRVIKQIRPDVVLSFSEGPNLIALLARGISARPVFLANIQAPPSQVHSGLYRPIYAALIRLLYRRAHKVIALSQGVRTELIERFGVPAHLVEVVHNPVDLAAVGALSAEAVDLPAYGRGAPVVLTVGRLMPAKNHPLLIRAFARVRARLAAQLVILGTGRMGASLREQIAAAGLEHDVHLPGWQSNPFKYMARAAVFVLSSDYEGLGNVLLEAMACGCPVVATDCPYGPREILAGGEYGILVPMRDEQAMAEAIVRVLSDPDLRQRLAERGRARAREFDVARNAAAYEHLLADLGPFPQSARRPKLA